MKRPKCRHENPDAQKFCGECGYNLSSSPTPSSHPLSFDEKIDKIQRYLPKGLTEKILSQKEKIEGERRPVTVMFCDMEGFAPLVEKLGCRSWTRYTRSLFTRSTTLRARLMR